MSKAYLSVSVKRREWRTKEIIKRKKKKEEKEKDLALLLRDIVYS